MDVLKPELIWVNGQCFRFFESGIWNNNRNITLYMEDTYEIDSIESESGDLDVEIIPYGDTKYKHTFRIPKVFFPHIVGSKNTVRKRIETDTKTSIQIPRIDQTGDIVIIGSDHKGIILAKKEIELLIQTTRKKLKFTHFLSVPMNEDHIVTNFNIFKEDVLNNCGKEARGVDEAIFQQSYKLHFTIGILLLLDDEEKAKAVKTLNDCKREVILPILKQHGEINITMEGIDYMNDDPTNVNVLYAKLSTKNNILQTLVNEISNYFAQTGLMLRPTENVKLHVTLMNTAYDLDDVGKKSIKNRQTFDATHILMAHKDTSFGTTTLKHIHISERSTANGQYFQAIGIIDLCEK